MMKKEWRFLLIAAAVFAVIVGLVNIFSLGGFPLSGDEYSYLFQSKIFAQGQLFAPAPTHPEFFQLDHVISDGKWYSKYTIGWPLLLAMGQLVRLPQVVNLIFGTMLLFLLFFLTKKYSDSKAGFFAVAIAGTAPFLIFNSASFFPHVASMLLEVAFLLFILPAVERKSLKFGSVAGVFLGILVLVRPLDAVIVAVPMATYGVIRYWRDRQVFKVLLVAAIVAGAIGALQLAVNYAQLGNAFAFGYQKYNPDDVFAFGVSWIAREIQVTFHRLFLGIVWFPVPLLLFLFGVRNKKPEMFLFLSIIALNFFIYFFYPYSGGDQFGPRYYGISFPLMCILAAIAIKKSSVVLALIVAANLVLAGFFAYDLSREVSFRSQVYDFVQKTGAHNSLVFMKNSPAEGCWWYARNNPSLQDDNLYVCDLGQNNGKLLAAFPERKAAFYDLALMKDSDSLHHKLVRYS